MSTIKDEKPEPKYRFNVVPESKLPPFTDHFPFFHEGIARCEKGGFILTPEFGKHMNEFIDFQLREDDTWVVTFPKCGMSFFKIVKDDFLITKTFNTIWNIKGTTWTQEMVWMIVNNCDQEAAKVTPLTLRSPFLE